MKRVLCAATLAGAALGTVPAHAATEYPVKVVNDEYRTGVGVELFGQPGPSAYRENRTGRICVANSYQVPFCTEPISQG
jgi:hypothetical protein